MQRDQRRPGFTLVELLVVIAILAILFSLTSAAVFKVMDRAAEVQVRTEISQLSQGIQAFMARFSLLTPPPANFNPRGTTDDSRAFLYRCWPNIQLAQITWPNANLEGDQALVFFLGGSQSGSSVLGFSTDPRNPSAAGGDRIQPFYDFKPERLVMRGSYLVYLDTFGNQQPYAYFSAGRASGTYVSNGNCCPTLGVQAYKQSATGPYYKPDGFQIISAGANGLFGRSSVWTSVLAPTIYPRFSDGSDDISNFYEFRMGAAPPS